MGNSHPYNNKILTDILTDVNVIKNKQFYEFIFNLILVGNYGRKSYLLESSDFLYSEYPEYSISNLLEIVSVCGLYYKIDITSMNEYPRYWITKEKLNNTPNNDKEIGELLGMKDPGGEYFNFKEKRVFLDISEEKTGANIITEIVLGDIDDIENQQYAKHKIHIFNKIMNHLNLPYNFVYNFTKDDGTLKRMNELKKKNMKYLIENKYQYINDFDNIIYLPEDINNIHPIINLFNLCLDNKKLLKKYLSLFIYIYQQLHNEDNDINLKVNLINRKFIDLLLLNGY
jgi:hypothetical protein